VKIIQRDEAEPQMGDFGQNVRDTFPKADFFIDVDENKDDEKINTDIRRFIELIFGNSFHTPTNDEFGMFNAYSTSLRSGSLARQVGATITNKDGEILSTGMNEIPRIGGGLITAESIPDQRNHILGYDPNDQKKYNIIIDLLEKLRKLGILNVNKKKSINELVTEIKSDLKGTYIMNLIEFTREVHAEMAALMAASRSTISIHGANLYTTTFPCHDCTKHIIAGGLKRVIYI
jgi:cytidine deaminase